jgi:YhcH/YjgK/YiaL family protein
MIAGSIQHVEAQLKETPHLKEAIAFLKNTNLGALPEGRLEVNGTAVYVMVQSYETIPLESAKIEAHKKYIDLQFVCAGEEAIGWIPVSRLAETLEYNEAKDVFFGKAPLEQMSLVRLAAGELAVLFPEDAHAPKLRVSGPVKVMKIVVKVAV